MRLWSIHPGYLDRAGLLAVWREALLAQAVLAGRTRGYRHHPQLERFRAHPDPGRAVAAYLAGIFDEARGRGYRFDRSRFRRPRTAVRIPVSRAQLRYELEHLRIKCRGRCPGQLAALPARDPKPHPLFIPVRGGIEDWERPRA